MAASSSTTLLKKVPASQIIAVVRNPSKATDFANKGLVVRQADYTDNAALEKAFTGVETLLLISSNQIGQRAAQHGNVIHAAKKAGVKHLVYTSLLHADRSIMSLAAEHVETERLIKASGIPFTILRNGWYTENYTASVPAALAIGAFIGSAGTGAFPRPPATITRAAAVVLSNPAKTAKVYELAGDEAYTLAELAAEIARQTGKPITYANLPEENTAPYF